MKNLSVKSALLSAALILTVAFTGCKSHRALAGHFDIDSVWMAYDAFNTVYLDTQKNIYKNTDRDARATDRWHGAAAIWCQPMYVDMALNAAELARREGDRKRADRYSALAVNLIEGNGRQYENFDFDNCDQNTGWFIYDDIQWWTITLARAYLATGNERYRQLAEQSFARVWYGSPRVGDTGSYADPAKGLGGGMFWQWQPIDNPRPNEKDHGKMSCINFPTVVAAMLLYQGAPADRKADTAPEKWTNSYGSFTRPHYETKERYLEMAKEIYSWSRQNLTDPATGLVHDHSHGGHAGGHPLLYNQGTFIGAAALLYLTTGEKQYLDDACAGADFSINNLSAEHGLLPWAHNRNNPYDQGSLEQGVYPAIWAQYMKLLVEDCGQKRYLPFLRRNVKEGWTNRNLTTLICDGESWKPTTSDALIGSYAASSVPSLMIITSLLEK